MRLPKGLKKDAEQAAINDRRSLASWIRVLIEGELERREKQG